MSVSNKIAFYEQQAQLQATSVSEQDKANLKNLRPQTTDATIGARSVNDLLLPTRPTGSRLKDRRLRNSAPTGQSSHTDFDVDEHADLRSLRASDGAKRSSGRVDSTLLRGRHSGDQSSEQPRDEGTLRGRKASDQSTQQTHYGRAWRGRTVIFEEGGPSGTQEGSSGAHEVLVASRARKFLESRGGSVISNRNILSRTRIRKVWDAKTKKKIKEFWQKKFPSDGALKGAAATGYDAAGPYNVSQDSGVTQYEAKNFSGPVGEQTSFDINSEGIAVLNLAGELLALRGLLQQKKEARGKREDYAEVQTQLRAKEKELAVEGEGGVSDDEEEDLEQVERDLDAATDQLVESLSGQIEEAEKDLKGKQKALDDSSAPSGIFAGGVDRLRVRGANRLARRLEQSNLEDQVESAQAKVETLKKTLASLEATRLVGEDGKPKASDYIYQVAQVTQKTGVALTVPTKIFADVVSMATNLSGAATVLLAATSAATSGASATSIPLDVYSGFRDFKAYKGARSMQKKVKLARQDPDVSPENAAFLRMMQRKLPVNEKRLGVLYNGSKVAAGVAAGGVFVVKILVIAGVGGAVAAGFTGYGAPIAASVGGGAAAILIGIGIYKVSRYARTKHMQRQYANTILSDTPLQTKKGKKILTQLRENGEIEGLSMAEIENLVKEKAELGLMARSRAFAIQSMTERLRAEKDNPGEAWALMENLGMKESDIEAIANSSGASIKDAHKLLEKRLKIA
jgi:hypothetical protein